MLLFAPTAKVVRQYCTLISHDMARHELELCRNFFRRHTLLQRRIPKACKRRCAIAADGQKLIINAAGLYAAQWARLDTMYTRHLNGPSIEHF